MFDMSFSLLETSQQEERKSLISLVFATILGVSSFVSERKLAHSLCHIVSAKTVRSGVIRLVSSYGVIFTIAGNGVSGYSGNGGPSIKASLRYPYGVAFEKDSSVIIADSGNTCIRKVFTNGTIALLVSTTSTVFSVTALWKVQASTMLLQVAISFNVITARNFVFLHISFVLHLVLLRQL